MATTRKVIPNEIQNLILTRLKQISSLDSGQYNFIIKLEEALKQFLKKHDNDPNYAKYHFKYAEKKTLEHDIRRAFNQKTPKGAVTEFRNLLCLFATEGQFNWNELIKRKYPKYKKLLDSNDSINHSKTESKRDFEIQDRLDEVDSTLKELLQLVRGEPEEQTLIKQIKDYQGQSNPSKFSSDMISETLSENDPSNPEFPPKPFYKPKFPATETKKYKLENFGEIWIKDESSNPTGTHKDRMAWEVTLQILDEETNIQEVSLISSGSAAIAVKHFFNLYGVKAEFKVLVDKNMSPEIKKKLKDIGCKLYETNLSKKELTFKDIKKLTDNKKGIDITYRETMDFHNMRYYDWMSYEILNIEPDYCFIPFGTGDLFINVLKIVLKEIDNRGHGKKHDPRFNANIDVIKNCHFIAATTNNPNSKMDKLFSHFLPHQKAYEQFIEKHVKNNCFGKLTNIYEVTEHSLLEALNISKQIDVEFEPSGAAGLAMALQMENKISPDSKILIINTGKTKYSPTIPKL